MPVGGIEALHVRHSPKLGLHAAVTSIQELLERHIGFASRALEQLGQVLDTFRNVLAGTNGAVVITPTLTLDFGYWNSLGIKDGKKLRRLAVHKLGAKLDRDRRVGIRDRFDPAADTLPGFHDDDAQAR